MKSKLFCFITIALIMSTMEVQGKLSREQMKEITAIIDELYHKTKDHPNKPDKMSRTWYDEAYEKWITGYRAQKQKGK